MPKKYVPAPPMTYAQLAAKLATFTPEQLAMPVRWWGEERGGEVQKVDVLDEEYICLDDRDGMEPVSVFAGEDYEESEVEERWPKGTPLLAVDNMVLAGDSK